MVFNFEYIQIGMNIMQDCITTHLLLVQINVTELIMISQIKSVFTIKQKMQTYIFLNLLTKRKKSKEYQHISCGCKCKFHWRKFNLNPKWNENLCRCDRKLPGKHHLSKKYSVLSHTTCAYVINRSLKSIANKIVKTCDEITDTKANSTTNYNKLPNKNCFNKF